MNEYSYDVNMTCDVLSRLCLAVKVLLQSSNEQRNLGSVLRLFWEAMVIASEPTRRTVGHSEELVELSGSTI